jgi:hypothetical protein
MEARALARLGDAKGCDRALAEAVRDFDPRKPGDDPAWIRYFDESELSAEFGHCLRDLGRATDAAHYASRSLVAVDGAFVRSDFFVTMVLADVHLASGELEQACDVALTGIRTEEARALRWSHVVAWVEDESAWVPVTDAGFDHERFAIYVWRSVRADGDTKTEKSPARWNCPRRQPRPYTSTAPAKHGSGWWPGRRGRTTASCSPAR